MFLHRVLVPMLLILMVGLLGACCAPNEQFYVSEIGFQLTQPTQPTPSGFTIMVDGEASLKVTADGGTMHFQWKAEKGKLSSLDRASTVYTAPHSPGLDTVSVTVADDCGGETVKSIFIQVLSDSTPTSTPTSAPTATLAPTSTLTSTPTVTLTPTPSLTPSLTPCAGCGPLTPTPPVVMTATVALRAWDDMYGSVTDITATRRLKAIASQIDESSRFTLLCLANDKVALKFGNTFASAMNDEDHRNWELRAVAPERLAWEEFTLVNPDAQASLPCAQVLEQLQQGEVRLAFRTFHGRFVGAMGEDQGWVLRAETTALDRYEKFTVINLALTPTVTLTPTPSVTPSLTPSPTPTPLVVDTMDSLEGWTPFRDPRSAITPTVVSGLFDQAIQLDFDLRQDGSTYVGIGKVIAPTLLSGTQSMRFYYKGAGQNTIELKLFYNPDGQGEEFRYSWLESTATIDDWLPFERPYSAFDCGNTCKTPRQELDPAQVRKLEIAVSHQLTGKPGPGRMLVDQIEAIRSSIRTRIRERDGATMVYVPAGNFSMGSDPQLDHDAESDETPQHTVYLDAFWIDRAEVTNAQYNQCVQAHNCSKSVNADDGRYNQDRQPVVGVNWNEAQAFCQWAGAQLPTEAQWEKAARGSDGRLYPWGGQVATCQLAIIKVGDVLGCPDGSAGQAARKVDDIPAADVSPYGVLDMAGNVWEWAADPYDGSFYSQPAGISPNPLATASSRTPEERLIRGGSWANDYKWARAAHRHSMLPTYRNLDLGFRCASSSP